MDLPERDLGVLDGDVEAEAVGAAALFQMCLGIATLVLLTPLPLALAHQFGAAVLWLATVLILRAEHDGNNIPST